MARLEKIRLKDFKSFRSATIPLCEGYTCIIGPNGSGKSNILDAIAFVLGTGSMKTLRANRLADLVNHHSRTGTASVTIELREGDKKYSITREIDKKGNSVFRLNGKRTTRHKIEDLLYSMNIQPDGHNLIMQGEITRLIRMTPLQRRKIIDEISGIAEYDQKKEEALRELEKVEEKIREAEIILSERQERLRELKKEKETAEEYSYLQARKKSYLASLVKKELDEVDKVYKKAEERIESRKKLLEKYSRERLETETRIEELKKQIKECETEIFQESSRRQKEAAGKLEALKQRLGGLESELRAIRESEERLERELAREREALASVSEDLAGLEKKIEDYSFQEDDLEREIALLKEDLEKLGVEKTGERIEKLFEEMRKLEEEVDKTREEISSLEKGIGALKERLNLKKALLEEELSPDLSPKEKELEKKRETTRKELEGVTRTLSSLDSRLKGLMDEEKEENKNLMELDKQMHAIRKKVTVLESRVRTYGIANTASRIVSAGLPGVLGTVAGLCQYPKEYERAIETAAGQRLFYIVTRTADDAVNAIRFLKEKGLGRATFIPLDKVRPPRMTKEIQKALKSPESKGLVIDFVRYPKELERAFQFVFGDTVLVKSVSGFKSIGIGTVRMVTPDGDLAEPSGIVSGGSRAEGKASARDALELERLREKLARMEEEKEKIINSLRDIREKMSRIREEKAAAEVKKKSAEAVLRELEAGLKDLEKDTEKILRKRDAVKKEIEGMEKALQEKSSLLREKSSKLEELLSKKAVLVSEIDRITSDESQKKAAEIREKINSLEEELARTRLSKKEAMTRLDHALKREHSRISGRIRQLQEELERARAREKEKEEERNKLLVQIKDAEEEVRKLAGSVTELFKKKSELEKELERLSEKIKRISRNAEKVKEEIKEAEIERARRETRRKDLEREWERLKDAELIKGSELELRKGLETVESQLEKLGHVNLKAIEMYDKESKEVSEIKEKKKKLETEKEAILKLMQEIETKKASAFMQAFNAVNTFFEKYFSEFYPEAKGKACLKLDNPDNPLESGLIIEANPKGVKMRNIDALSGGEKTITALAFIFAIQAYNPSPFYVLDEVEAALDAPNSERVARMFKKFSEKIQLIIITHNSAVTRYADQIIGVHMSKDKSSFVEVNLKELATA